MMRLFESILDAEGIVNKTVSSADLLNNGYELPSFLNHSYMLILANGSNSYDKLIELPNLITERFERLQDAMQSFRHIKSCSDFAFYVHKTDIEKFDNMPEYIQVTDSAPGFFVSFDPDFRTEKETFRFFYILNQIATGGIGGSISILSSEYTKLFIDYENMDWIAEYNNLPSVNYRSHNIFYDESKVQRQSKKIFEFLRSQRS